VGANETGNFQFDYHRGNTDVPFIIHQCMVEQRFSRIDFLSIHIKASDSFGVDHHIGVFRNLEHLMKLMCHRKFNKQYC
jgi:hypothetical protein